MKRLTIALLAAGLCALLLTGCGCDHVYGEPTCTEPAKCTLCGEENEDSLPLGHLWQDATCAVPKTCSECGATEGKTKAHKYSYATCTAPKTCKECGATSGSPLSHKYKAATCTDPKICKDCGTPEGDPKGHTWKAATCTAAKTCSVCKVKEGEPLGHKLGEATCTKAATCSVCKKTVGKALGHSYEKNLCTVCGDVMIETHSELESYLNKNFKTLTTKIGTMDGLTFEVVHNEPNYWDNQDFEVRIESTIWFEEVQASLGYALVYADFLPYEDRIQAVVDVLNYQKEIVEIAEAAFPGQKFEVKFYTWGYEYPNIKVGFNSETQMCWRNWERIPNTSSVGYAATQVVDWKVYSFDALYYGTYDQKTKIKNDIRKAWTFCDFDEY